MNPQKATHKIHPDFKWNGKALNKAQLLDLASSYIGSEEKHLHDIGLFLKAWFDDNSLIEVQTSGSTGAPKKMWVKKQYMVNSAKATQNFFELPAKTTALLCLPATYIAGKLMIVRALTLGLEIDSVKPQANPLAVHQKSYDFTAVTPYQLENSLANLELVRKVMVGGGMVSAAVLAKIQNVSTEIYETYAMTETLTHIAARRINNPQQIDLPPFTLLKDVEISTDDRDCLVIKAPKVSDETIVTNDIVELESNLTFRLKGRYDNVINSGGIKIFPSAVENKLSPLISPRFFVSGLPDDTLGQQVVLFIEGEILDFQLTDLKQQISTSAVLDKYEVPKQIIYVSKFVETHTGKINRLETIRRAGF